MNMDLKLALCALAFSALVGCSAAGVVASSNPQQKLADADALLDQGRPLPAERLIVEAVQLCTTAGDQLCLADAYRGYGLFFMSSALASQKDRYVSQGFLDATATYQQRFVKANEYLEKSRAIYAQAARFEVVTNLNLNRGFAFEMAGDKSAACQAYGDSLAASQENTRLKPGAVIQVPAKYGTFERYIGVQRARVGCGT
jgi:tetratricopeptide (TPR) repeat protein